MEKKVVMSCDYTEIEKIIFEEYGQLYEIMPMEEIGSSQHNEISKYSVSKRDLNEFEQEDVSRLVAGKPKQYTLNTILKDLCNKGKLEEGDYFINVSW